MNKKDVAQKILWSTIEDFVGMFEILWEINTLSPNKIESQNREVAEEILIEFKNNALVNFYFCKWPDEFLEKIPENKIFELLNGDRYWKAPSVGDVCIKVGNTKKGEEYYQNDIIEDLY